MKILILANSDIGLYNFRKELLETLIKENNQIIIALPNGQRISDLKKLGCQYFSIKLDRRGMNPLSDLLLLKRYCNLIKVLDPEMILTYTIKPNIYGGIAASLKHKEYITNITGLGSSIENGGIISKVVFLLYKVALRNAKCVFFQNKSNKEVFFKKGFHFLHSRIIPGSGVNLDYHTFEEYPCESMPITFLFIGRIMKEKGIDELFKALEKVRKKNIKVICNLIGFYEENYRERIEQLENQGLIKYFGFQEDVRPYIKKSWAIIQPSYHEGLSNVLLEASAAGRPVLASRIPGCQEAFEEEVTGIGFEAHDSEEIAFAIEKFVLLPYEKKKKMGKEARRKMEKEFDRKLVVKEYLEEIKRKKI